jgi:two-component system alkaline phosphatase synthesis response regulator PhoP
MNALLVEATEELQPLAEELERAGFRVRTCSLEAAREELASGDLLDVVLVSLVDEPNEAAIRDLLRDLSVTPRVVSVALVRRHQLTTLDPELPVDDFAVVPVAAEELSARVQRIARRRAAAEDGNVLRCGDLSIDQASYKAFVGSRPVELTYKEYELLRFLALSQDKVCTRETLLNRVWGYDFYGGHRTVDVHIRRLRGKIEDRGHTFIETVRNVGYRFRAG